MFQDYIEPISIAFMLFPFIAFLITLPYIIHQYHKYGSVAILRVVIVYSFILYLMTCYFLVILPLPTRAEVASMTGPATQLIPFNFITDIANKSGLVLTDFSTYIDALTSPAVYQVLYNIILFVPFGIYLRYYFKFSFKKTVLYSFLLSLFFELTQLSGLYFIYPRSYRLFDVDDLIVNTLGGLLGYLITPAFVFFLPSRDKLDEKSYQKGKHISFLRRLLAFIIDNIIALILTTFLITVFNFDSPLSTIFSFVATPLYHSLISILTKGSTLGKMLLKIKVKSQNLKTVESEAKWYQYLIRYFFLYLIYLPLPIYVYNLSELILAGPLQELSNYQNIISLIVSMLTFIVIILWIVIKNTKEESMIYEKLSKTKLVSTIKVKKNLVKSIKKDRTIAEKQQVQKDELISQSEDQEALEQEVKSEDNIKKEQEN